MIAFALALCGSPPALAQEEGYGLDEGIALLGIIVGAKERDAVDVVVEDGKFLLPAEETFQAINTRLRREDAGTFLDTPIGSIEIASGMLREIDDATFIGEDFLIETLSTPVSFDIESYAVVLEPPWSADEPLQTGTKDDSSEGVVDIEPDVVPPIIGMTSVHADVFTTYSSAADDIGVSTELEVNGHAAGGVWRLRYSGTLDKYELADYAWMREVSDNIWTLIGRQQVGVHPLIDVVDMTGAQIAYSNKPAAFEEIEEVSGSLLNRAGGSDRRFVGNGPPGGRVELVIDGISISETIIGVDGSYAIESPLLGQQRNDVEIRVFEPLSNNQIDTVRLTVTANRFLAPEGSFNVIAGAGVEGNVLDIERDTGGATGFARVRYAPLEDLTVEAAVIYDPEDGIEGAVGAAVQLGKFGTAYAGAGMKSDGSTSYEGLYYASYGKLTLNARGQYREIKGQTTGTNNEQDAGAETFNHYAEVSYDYSTRLRFGAIARHTVQTSYVLPYAIWRPRSNLFLSARPSSDGEYRFEARATPFENINLQVFYEGKGFARVSYDFETEATGSSAISFDVDYDTDDGGLGLALGASGSRIFGLDAKWRLRALRNETSSSASAGLRKELRPGLSVYGDAGMRFFDDGRENELFGSMGLSVDLGYADGSFSGASRLSTNPRFGRLTGRIIAPEGVEVTDEDLAGAKIIVDEKPAGRVGEGGEYWLPQIAKGIHAVRLEADELPVDLVIDSGVTYAKIAPGAATPVNFKLAVEVGAAGRIIGPDGEPVEGVPLQMLNPEGEVVSRARSNQFGLYRLDGLRPGAYTLKALDIWEGASRPIEIGSKYGFGNDMKVAKPSKPRGDEEAPVTQP